MARYILSRLLGLVFVLIAVSMITFFLTRMAPGDPFAAGERQLPAATQAARAAKYGFDQPLWRQYLNYVDSAVHGDFGVPFQSPTTTVLGLIRDTWPITLKIGLLTIGIAYPVGIALGFLAAIHRNQPLDYFLTFGASLGLVLPNFVVAVWLILLFSVKLDWLPTGGWGKPQHYVLPVLAYALAPMALVARYTRTSLVDTLGADYVRTARAKGIGERRVLIWHVARNALIPFVTVMLPEIPNILTGSIFIEQTFRIPGLGRFFVTSTFTRDYPMIMALVLLVAIVWGVMYLLTDILYTLLDPRIRL
ncbi:MAG: ABC transporter permease [Thermomicrobiales bacterium]|nr:ABC transporter permease [Thermomicrobiales bacterium]